MEAIAFRIIREFKNVPISKREALAAAMLRSNQYDRSMVLSAYLLTKGK